VGGLPGEVVVTRRFVPVAVLAIVVSMAPVASRAVGGTQLVCRFKGVMRFQPVYGDSRVGSGLLAITAGGTLPGTCVVVGLKPKEEAAIADFNTSLELNPTTLVAGWYVLTNATTGVPSTEGVFCDTTGRLGMYIVVRTPSGAFIVGLGGATDWPGINGETPILNGTSVGVWSESILGVCPVTYGSSAVSLAFTTAFAPPSSGG